MEMDRGSFDAEKFTLPKYTELPEMGLYLEQMLAVVNGRLGPILAEPVTGAMISNYIKNGAVPSPVSKKYMRVHICYIMVTCMMKQVFTIQQITQFFEIQRVNYPLDVAFNFFCAELLNALKEAFNFTGNALPSIETQRTIQTMLVRSIVLSVANKICVEKKYLAKINSVNNDNKIGI